jgi:hypothetical protein
MRDAVRLATSAAVDEVPPGDVFAVAADLRNLPAWWIEHLHAEVVVPATRLRDTVYAVRYRMPWGFVISATCTVVAARGNRSLTYVWVGGGMRLAVGQQFEATPTGTAMRMAVDFHVGRVLSPMAPVIVRLMRRELRGEMDRALETLGELAAARSVMRRSGRQTGGGGDEPAPSDREVVPAGR